MPLAKVDQSRYGPAPGAAPGQPKKRKRPRRWWLWVIDVEGRVLHDSVVHGDGRARSELAEFEARADFGAAILLPR